MRRCPFCSDTAPRRYGARGASRFVRCVQCHSIYRDLSLQEYEHIHAVAFADGEFANVIDASQEGTPARARWRWLSQLLPDGDVLEVGPGTGHLLEAARRAGRVVAGVESSALHRQLIDRTWGIDTVYATFDALGTRRFDAVIVINTFEHIYNIDGFLRQAREHMNVGGVMFISTPNARCAILPIVRTYWTPFKVTDHVSFPTRKGMWHAAKDAGLTLERVWTSELPLETPIGIAAAVRDFTCERIRRKSLPGAREHGDVANPGIPISGKMPLARQLRWSAMRAVDRWDPTSRLTASLGLAATAKALMRRD